MSILTEKAFKKEIMHGRDIKLKDGKTIFLSNGLFILIDPNWTDYVDYPLTKMYQIYRQGMILDKESFRKQLKDGNKIYLNTGNMIRLIVDKYYFINKDDGILQHFTFKEIFEIYKVEME